MPGESCLPNREPVILPRRSRSVAIVRVGIHLPQFGRAASPESITRAARAAEDLGFADVWVSDHIAIPAAQDYPSPYLYDPLLSLAWAAAATERVGLGTSVLVIPQHNALALANSLASLDALSGGRLTVGAGVGWSAAEFAALGQSFTDRGRRLDEMIDVLRACWGPDPVNFEGEFVHLDAMKVQPKPAHPIPIWIGGSSEPAYVRAASRGDGFHAIGLDPVTAAIVVERLRRDHPDPSFTISLRTGWDPQGMDVDVIRRERDEFEAAGIQHVVSAPWRNDPESWLRSMELLAGLVLAG
jgi:probable F420-dependent oxidoreductase